MNSIVKLQSSDKRVFTVPAQVISCSETITSRLKNWSDTTQGAEEPLVVLDNVSGDILQRVLAWAEFHNDKPAPELAKEWDAGFMEVDHQVLFELTMAANNLGIPRLAHLICTTLAKLMREDGSLPQIFRNLQMN